MGDRDDELAPFPLTMAMWCAYDVRSSGQGHVANEEAAEKLIYLAVVDSVPRGREPGTGQQPCSRSRFTSATDYIGRPQRIREEDRQADIRGIAGSGRSAGLIAGAEVAARMMSAARLRFPVVGREAELAVLAEVVGVESRRRGLLLTGWPGVGKTTVWEAGIAAAQERGMVVLSVRSAAAEVDLSFSGLADLLEPVKAQTLAGLPGPQRRALEIALVRAEPGDAPPGPRPIATGLLGVLRVLAAGEPLLVAIDDVQWLDRASAQALAFAVRRLAGEPVRVLLARRAGDPLSAVERAFAPMGLVRLELEPLSFGAIRSLVVRRLGAPLTRRMLRQLFEASGGNPFLALELGRLLAERGAAEVGQELPTPELVEDLVGARVVRLSPAVRRSLLAVALSPGLGAAQLAMLEGGAAVEEALDEGVLVAERERLPAAHPLLAAAARGLAKASERRKLHLALAGSARFGGVAGASSGARHRSRE